MKHLEHENEKFRDEIANLKIIELPPLPDYSG